jgi:hypothetical protein
LGEAARTVDFFALPYWILMAVLVVFSAVAACGLHAVVHRSVPYVKLVEHNEVAGFMIAVVGVLYSVLIAFVVVVVWQQYNEADANYSSEVSGVADIFAFGRLLPAERTRPLEALVTRYVAEMVDDEGPARRSARASAAATATLAQLSRFVDGIATRTTGENEVRAHLQSSVQHVFDLRNRRLSDNTQTLPPVLWAALLVGACITVGFGFLFGVVNFRIQLIMTAAVAALIAVMFTLLIELDFPFRRDTAISAERWFELRHYLKLTRVGGRSVEFARGRGTVQHGG